MLLDPQNASAHRMQLEVENRLFSFANMKRQVAAFTKDMLSPGVSAAVEPRRGSLPGNPTEGRAMQLLEPPAHIANMQEWIAVINKAWDEMRYYAPELARILERFYGLTMTDGRKAKGNARIRYDLMEELHISQTTLYNKRAACINWVQALALYKGLLCPYLDVS